MSDLHGLEDGTLMKATLDSLSRQMEFFERAASFGGRSRERVVAIAEAEELFIRLHPHQYRVLQAIRISSQLSRLDNTCRNPIQKCENRLISLLMSIILSGLRTGDLCLRDRQRPAELAFTLWSLAFGTRALMDTSVATRQLGIDDGFRVACDATDLMLDTMNWVPLSSEWDYGKTRASIREGLFAEEWRGISKAGMSCTA